MIKLNPSIWTGWRLKCWTLMSDLLSSSLSLLKATSLKIFNHKNNLIMELYKYEKDSLSFKKVSYVKWLKMWSVLSLAAFLYGVSRPAKTDIIEKLTPVEQFIVINEANKFTEERFVEEIKRLNFRFPHIVYAQSVIETGGFSSRIFVENHNLFGMKEAHVRAHLAVGTQHNHAYYNNWKESLYDYALYYSEYLSSIRSEEDYLNYINQRYAEDPNYDTKVRKLANESKKLFGIN